MKKILQNAGIGLAAAAVTLMFWGSGLLSPWEARTWDWRARLLAAPGAATEDIALILLDQNSLDWAASENGLSWPWPREVYGAVVDFCRMAGARALAVDVLFTEPSAYGVEDDAVLSEASRAYGRLAAAMFPGTDTGNRRQWPAGVPPPALDADDHRASGTAAGAFGRDFPRATFPIDEIARSAAVLGSVSLAPDPDGTYRRTPLIQRFDGRLVPALGLAPLLTDGRKVRVAAGAGGLSWGGHHIPVDRRGRALLRYRGPSGTHARFSAAAVIQSYLRILDGQQPVIDPEALRGKYVFFGFSAPGLFDLRPSPVDGVYSGVEIHATMLDNFLSGDFLQYAPRWATVCLTAGLAAAAAIAVTAVTSAAVGAVIGVGFFVLPALLGVAAYNGGYWLPVVVQTAAVSLSLAAALGVNYTTEGRQKRFIKNAFRQYLSPAVIDQLIRHPERLKLGGERRVLSIFFSDLQGFTSISEGLDPEALTALLNEYLSAMTDIIHEERGTVDKYEGDAIIAFWNAPLTVSDHGVRIVRAALRCQARLTEMRPDVAARIGKELHMRIGINTGPAVVGNMGSYTRFDYTMLGDAVNLAARLEGVNKQFGTFTMISDATRRIMGDEFAARELARVAVVGKKAPVVVYEPMMLDDFQCRRPVLDVFRRGLDHFYAGRFDAAVAVFTTIADVDPPARHYLAKCRDLIAAPPEDWDGVWVMTTK